MNLKLNCHHTCCTDNKIKVMPYNKSKNKIKMLELYKKNKSNLLEHAFTHVPILYNKTVRALQQAKMK